MVAVVGLAFLLLYYGFAWLRVGRDPPIGTIIPMFGPPDGMSPAATRYVDRMSFDDRCFTAAIINLGVKGHLQIVEEDGKTTLKKRGGGKPARARGRDVDVEAVRGEQGSLLLNQTNHVPLGRAKNGLDEALDKKLSRQAVRQQLWMVERPVWSWCWLIVMPCCSCVGRQPSVPCSDAVMIAIFGVPLMMAGAAMVFVGWQRVQRGKWLLISGVILAALVAAVALASTWADAPGVANLVLTGAMLAMGALAGIGFPLLKAPSRSGRKIMDEIEGFREYLSVAEEDRLNALNPPEKTPELFETIPALCGRARLPERLGREIRRRAGCGGCGRGRRRGLVCGQPRLVERSGVVRRPSRRRPVVDHLVVIDCAGLQRRWRRRQQRRRLLRRRWRWRRRRWLVRREFVSPRFWRPNNKTRTGRRNPWR